MHPPSEDVHQTGSSPLVGGGEQAVRAVNRAGSSDGVPREDRSDDAGNGGSRSGVPKHSELEPDLELASQHGRTAAGRNRSRLNRRSVAEKPGGYDLPD